MASTPGGGGAKWTVGVLLFASIFMVVGGIFHLLSGLAAVIDPDAVSVAEEYTYDVDVTAWGWLHIFIGAVMAGVGAWLFTGAIWARILAGLVMIFSAMLNFVYIPYEPLWSIVLLVIDGVVLWSLMMAPDYRPEEG